MKNKKSNVGSFATVKLQAKMRSILAIIAFVAVIGFSIAACGGGDDGDGNGNQGTAPTITTTSLPNGTVGTAYSQTLAATGDTPITWTIDGTGTLPTGLSLAPSTGIISGTPTAAATSTFTVKATNAKGSGTKQLSITIAAGSGVGDGNLSSAWFEPIGSPVAAYRVINGGTPPNQVVIPATYNGLPVTEIGDFAFSKAKLTSVTIGSGITNIGTGAFVSCTSLTSVIIPNSVTSIGTGAFSGCTSLTSVTIGNKVTNIAYDAFSLCTSLTAINVDASNTTYSSTGGVLYNKTKTELILFPTNKAGAFTIPNSVTMIWGLSFSRCTSITSIVIPSSVTRINRLAFSGCTNLTSVTFQGTITSTNFINTSGDHPFDGDLRAKFYATDTTNGTPGTYTTTAPVSDSSVWTKQ